MNLWLLELIKWGKDCDERMLVEQIRWMNFKSVERVINNLKEKIYDVA